MTVKEWIMKEIEETIDIKEYRIPQIEKNALASDCVKAWEGTDDPLDDENERMRDRITAYIEDQIVDFADVLDDKAAQEEETED